MKTIDYINYRISETKDLPDASDIDWKEATSHDPFILLKELFKLKVKNNNIILHQKYDGDKTKSITICKNPQSPNIVRLKQIQHDGTLLFSYDAIREMMEGIVAGSTYAKQNSPEDYGDSNFFNYTVKYSLGELLWHTTFVKHVDEKHGKMFPGQRDVFAMAVQVEYERIKT